MGWDTDTHRIPNIWIHLGYIDGKCYTIYSIHGSYGIWNVMWIIKYTDILYDTDILLYSLVILLQTETCFFLFVRVSFFCKGYCKECASGPLWNSQFIKTQTCVCVCIWIMVPVEVRIRSARVLLHDSHMKIPPVKLFPWVSLSISFRLGFVCWLVLCWFIMTWFAAYLHHFCCFVWLCMTLGLTLW
jgi:hypothetical protein